jgi:hypothetical protein
MAIVSSSLYGLTVPRLWVNGTVHSLHGEGSAQTRHPALPNNSWTLVRIRESSERHLGNESTAGIRATRSHVSAHESFPSTCSNGHHYYYGLLQQGNSAVVEMPLPCVIEDQSHSCQAELVIFVEHIQSSNHHGYPVEMPESGPKWAPIHPHRLLSQPRPIYHAYHGALVGVVSRV